MMDHLRPAQSGGAALCRGFAFLLGLEALRWAGLDPFRHRLTAPLRYVPSQWLLDGFPRYEVAVVIEEESQLPSPHQL